MSKIICDVCGTRYPESAERCPICGCVPAAEERPAPRAVEFDDDQPSVSSGRVRGGRFSSSNVRKRNQSANELQYEMPQEPTRRRDRDEDEEDAFVAADPQKRTGLILNILLVIVIVALLAVSAYIFVEYFMPNIMGTETVPTAAPTAAPTEEPTEAPTEAPTEEPTIPCTDLILAEDMVELNGEGQMYLLNVAVTPEDTTDMLTYASSDESVVTVNEEGRITAVSEGVAVITIRCGDVQIECNVLCVFNGETQPEEEGDEESDEPTEPAGPTEPLKDVTLKLNYEDLTFKAPNLGAKLKVEGLSNDEVEWISDDPDVATVDNGQVISVGSGNTYIRVRYGDQEVSCLIRCMF